MFWIKQDYWTRVFFMYGEDIDLSYRIIKAGYNNYYLPDKIIHYKGESTKKHEMRYVKIFYKAMYIFFKKYYPNSSRIYSFFIVSGIYTRASLEAVSRFMRKIFRIKKKPKRYETILFDHSVKSYEEMIETMDEKGNKNVEYVIYSPKSGMTIGAHFAEKRG
ncbi:MAG: glycosyltransferase family 2 protein [Dysgonomonas sp.]